jgi:hypothetical protein
MVEKNSLASDFMTRAILGLSGDAGGEDVLEALGWQPTIASGMQIESKSEPDRAKVDRNMMITD